jgi:hypothetical protein
MDSKAPAGTNGAAPLPQPLEDRARALAELHRQMLQLNAQLEYLHLILRLGLH